MVRVEGTLTAGDDPVQGRLIFGGFYGAPHAVLWTDEDGLFEGLLPAAGEWRLDAEVGGQLLSLPSVLVEARGGRPARLDLQLPGTLFHGKVTFRGEGVAGADLWGWSVEPGKSFRFDTTTDAEGRFELRGVAASVYEVTVSSARRHLASPRSVLEIREEADPPPADFELEEYQRLEGQILANGNAVPLAPFEVHYRSRTGDGVQPGQGDAAGVLRVAVPESAREIAMMVAPVGFAWQLVALRPGAPFFVEAAQNGGALQIRSNEPGSLRIWNSGVELPLARMAAMLERAGKAHLEAHFWGLENAAPGLYRACSANGCVEGFLPPSGSLTLEMPDAGSEILPNVP